MKSILTLSAVVALFFISSCQEHEMVTSIPVDGDYLPTSRTESYFLREQFGDVDFEHRNYYDTIKVSFLRDTLIGNNTFHAFEFYSKSKPEFRDLYKFFRKDGPRYFNLPLGGESDGYVFLDIEKPAGSSWFYTSRFGDVKTIYTVRAVNAVRFVNNIKYTNVIEMEQEIMAKDVEGQFYRVGLAKVYYAKDVGEIYSTSAWFVYTGAMRVSSLR